MSERHAPQSTPRIRENLFGEAHYRLHSRGRALPDDETLLCMKSLKAATEKVGMNLAEPAIYRDFKIYKGNANCMDLFEDERFDVVICNAVIEHDKYFWNTLAEIKRVTKRGGLVVIGAPGYTYFGAERIKNVLAKTL